MPFTRHGTVSRGLAGPVLAMAAWLCVVAVLLAGCGGAASTSAGGSTSAPCPGSSRAAFGTWQAADSCTRQPLYAVACLSALRCEAVGAAGTIRSTIDGGVTWLFSLAIHVAPWIVLAAAR